MKNLLKSVPFIVVGTLLSVCFPLYAQEITAIDTDQAKVIVGAPVKVQVHFNVKESPNPFCGLVLDFGDGNTHNGRPGLNGSQEFPYVVSHTYGTAGTYTVKVTGTYISRGLRSALACTGETKQVRVVVASSLPDKATETIDRKSQELAAKELELRRLSEKLESDRRILERNQKEIEAKKSAGDLRNQNPTGASVTQPARPVLSPKTSIDPF